MPYQNFPDWQTIVRGKHLIFDTDVVISLIAFNAVEVLDEMKRLGSTFTYINPVLLELMNTDSEREKLRRSTVLSNYGFVELPVLAAEIKFANRIQKSLPIGIKGKPSPTDYYLGGALARYSQSKKAFLLTSNVKDFPAPIFTREATLTLVNQTDIKSICVVGLDNSQLIE